MSSTSSLVRALNMAKNAFQALSEAKHTISDLNRFRLINEAIGELNKAHHLLNDLREGLAPAAQEEWERTSTSYKEK